MVKKSLQRIYLALIFLFLYLPILVLVVLSFNSSKSRVIWGGFTLKWYASCFSDETIMNAFFTTMQITIVAALISTIIGTLAAIGISAMKKRNRTKRIGFFSLTSPEKFLASKEACDEDHSKGEDQTSDHAPER